MSAHSVLSFSRSYRRGRPLFEKKERCPKIQIGVPWHLYEPIQFFPLLSNVRWSITTPLHLLHPHSRYRAVSPALPQPASPFLPCFHFRLVLDGGFPVPLQPPSRIAFPVFAASLCGRYEVEATFVSRIA
ncbi:hypothetical protein PIB30_010062 [Stylosanthes scabra]|uniref:Uncharacterized protein n=1 Tax=Stylosanthes scabra TaxID=79078 RepID=A0ABU6X548_9FABA|nr:hypothetical protein [Stylosanthes scabra]